MPREVRRQGHSRETGTPVTTSRGEPGSRSAYADGAPRSVAGRRLSFPDSACTGRSPGSSRTTASSRCPVVRCLLHPADRVPAGHPGPRPAFRPGRLRRAGSPAFRDGFTTPDRHGRPFRAPSMRRGAPRSVGRNMRRNSPGRSKPSRAFARPIKSQSDCLITSSSQNAGAHQMTLSATVSASRAPSTSASTVRRVHSTSSQPVGPGRESGRNHRR